MSDHDIQASQRWGAELSKVLPESQIGIICLTRENLKSQWLTFEAGALSREMTATRVIPYRFGMDSTDVGPPLSQFQGVGADRQGTYRLVKSINDAMGNPLDGEERLTRSFDRWWPDLDVKIASIPRGVQSAIRSDREILEEILELARHTGIRDLNHALTRVLMTPNVRRVEVAPKQIAGNVTNRLALRVTVARKLPLSQIPAEEIIPDSIFGLPTDVVEGA